jgi:general secretion pathway protein I
VFRADASRGFTLIEVMVALAVLGLAALALLRLEGATIRSTVLLDQTAVAGMVARSLATEAATDGRPPALGRSGGSAVNGGRTWTWTREVSALGDGRALRIDVAVAAPGGPPVARLTAVRPPATGALVRR